MPVTTTSTDQKMGAGSREWGVGKSSVRSPTGCKLLSLDREKNKYLLGIGRFDLASLRHSELIPRF
jgi:hypothetical protein